MHIVFIEKAFVMKIILLIQILAGVVFVRSCSAISDKNQITRRTSKPTRHTEILVNLSLKYILFPICIFSTFDTLVYTG